MDDNQLFALFWKCLAAVLIGIVGILGSCTMHQNWLKAELIGKATNPALMQCSLSEAKSSAFCIEVARQK